MSETNSPADELRNRIRELIAKMGTDPTRLAKQIGKSKDYIRDFLDGRKESLNAYTLRDIERVAEVKDGWLIAALPAEPGEDLQPDFHSKRVADIRMTRLSERKTMPIYPAREMLGSREILIDSTRIDDLFVPPFLRNDDGAYAVLMEGESMFPAYEAGDSLLMSPAMGIRRGYDAIVYEKRPLIGHRNIQRPEPSLAHVLRIIDFDEDKIKGMQFGKPGEFELDRDRWGGVVRIVGKYNRR